MPNPFRQGRDDMNAPIEINVTIKSDSASGDAGDLKTLIKALAAQLTQVKKEILMATSAEFQAGFDRLNTATSQIATVLAGISANLGSMTKDEENAAKAQLDAAVASLEAMAASATNPVPVEPPVVTP
jgi:uncharacterized protein YukE